MIVGNSYFKLLFVLIVLQHLFLHAKISGLEMKENTFSKWELTAYNFGGMEKLKPEEQINLLNKKASPKVNPTLYIRH